MRPLSLTVKGLRSWHAERTIPFADLDLLAVVGDTGAGKSSILEAVCYALYNQATYKGGPKTLICDRDQTMSVSLQFQADGEVWKVTRSTSHKNYPPAVHRLQCVSDPTVDVIDKEGPVNERIVELVGLDFTGFTSAVLLPQGRFKTLLDATDADRAKILKGIFNLDVLDDVRTYADQIRRLVQPKLEDAIAVRAALMDDPQRELDAAVADRDRAEQVAGALKQLVDRHNSATRATVEQERLAREADADAQRLRELAAGIPDITGVADVHATLDRLEADVRARGSHQRDALNTAAAALAEHAGRGETATALSAAAETLKNTVAGRRDLERDQADLQRDAAELDRQTADLASRQQAADRQAAEPDPLAAAAQLAQDEAELVARSRDAFAETLRELRAAQEAAREATDARDNADAVATAAEGEQQAAHTRAQKLTAASDHAAQRLRDGEQAHRVAAVAAGCAPGDPCPVCEQQLPATFEVPHAGTLDELRDAAAAAAEQAAAAARTAAGAAGRASELRRAHAEAVAVLDAKVRAADDLHTTAREIYGDDVDDDARAEQLLRTLTDAAHTAAARVGEAERDLAAAQATRDAAATALAEEARRLQDTRARLDEQRDRLQERRDALTAAVDDLPDAVRPAALTDQALKAAQAVCGQLLDDVQQLTAARDAAQAARQQLLDEFEELRERRRLEVTEPLQDARSAAATAAGALAALPDAPVQPAAPPADAHPGDVSAWTQQIEQACRQASQVRADAGDAARERIVALAAEQAASLAEADAVHPNNLVASLADMQQAADAWAQYLADARTRVKDARSDLELLPAAEQRKAELEALRDICDELARILADGKFIKWLVARRQRELLAFASDILGELTKDRFGFNASFDVVDSRSKTPRNARTLSGGEGFLASLALALGMVELTRRSGGKMGSFWLDEGFGTLDPTALNAAIDALQQRADDGKLIVLVSHVKAVAEQIGQVMKITSEQDGSDWQLLDADGREALAAEAVAEELQSA